MEKYGKAEVESWYFEVWNEPEGESYWKGTPEEFFKLHDYAIDAVRRALPTARVGGPDSANGGSKFTEDFYAHVARGTNYATGAKGTRSGAPASCVTVSVGARSPGSSVPVTSIEAPCATCLGSACNRNMDARVRTTTTPCFATRPMPTAAGP